MTSSDVKVDLVINQLTRAQYATLQSQGKLCVDQLYFLTDGRTQVSSDTRYGLYTKELQNATITIGGQQIQALSCQVEDLGITTVQITSNTKPVYLYLPEPATEGARDFCVRVEVTTQTPPTFGFLAANESCDFESTQSDWDTIEYGVNLFNFTETKGI